MSFLLDVPPSALGLPSKFESFRSVQAEGIDDFLSSAKRFSAANAPPGVGKSLFGMACGVMSDAKTVYLVSTKALQQQLGNDFASIGLKDIRGKGNYPCSVYTKKARHEISCEYGDSHGCYLAQTVGCPYTAAYESAKSSQLISTNYAYWLRARKANAIGLTLDKEAPIQLLICDEAHLAFEELASFLRAEMPGVEFLKDAAERLTGSGLMSEGSGETWRSWARARGRAVTLELTRLADVYGSIQQARENDDEYVRLERLKQSLKSITNMGDNWIWERTDQGVAFDCIWPGEYGGSLWSGVGRILLLSATLYPYTLKLLGLKPEDYDYRQFDNGWPKNRGLIYFWPAGRLNFKATDEDYRRMTERMDEIISSRYDRKGIIHTVSYARMRRLIESSKHRSIMFTNDAASESLAVATKFRAAKPPAVLVSPSYSTGWDFPYDQCEYQIIPKIPFPYAETRVMQERCKDVEFRTYCAFLELVQSIGRGRRAPDDRCESFILDSAFGMMSAPSKKFAGKEFSVHKIAALPTRPAKL